MKRKLIVLSIFIGATLISIAPTANAHAPWKHPEGSLLAPQLHFLKFLRHDIVHQIDDKCLTRNKPKSVNEIAEWNRQRYIVKWSARRTFLETRPDRCRPTSVAGIIRFVFPDATEDEAIAVADCESGLYARAKNPVSSASGVFQLLSFHWAGKFDPFDPWENTQYAYRLSDRGYNWSAWVCKP